MHDTLAEVRAGYDRWAEVYDHDGNPLQALEAPVVRNAVGDVSGLTVLDLGCGTGCHALWLAENGARVTAVDFSRGMLAAAQKKPPARTIEFLCHDLHDPLPLPTSHFNLVVSGLVLEHLRDLNAFFREIWRVLQPCGRAVVSAMHPAMFLRGSQARFTDPLSGEVVQPGSVPHTLSEMLMAAVHAGFQIEQLAEHAPDEEFADGFPRAKKYVGWPMLVAVTLHKQSPGRLP